MSLQEIISSNENVLVDFYADWCEPCKWVESILTDVLNKFDGRIVLHKLDIDKHAEIARQYHILSVPTLLLFKNAKEIWRMRGFDTVPALTKVFSAFIDA